MSAPRAIEVFARLDALLSEALDRPLGERAAFLAARTADADELAQALTLLRAAESAPEFAGLPSINPATGRGLPPQIGSWRVLEPLGAGGMADVVLAERTLEGTVQRSAIKLLKTYWNDPESKRRFGRERAILVGLDDARIARLLDGGMLDDGRPWLALEYIRGEHIDRWCDSRRLDLRARVQLLREVAGAVASAHRNLVIHRDIKPANVLVSSAGQVKLLDFGIAKVMAEVGDSEQTAPATRAPAFTPEFASPEQLAGQRISTASDIYQLGLLLYVLVSSVRPFVVANRDFAALVNLVTGSEAPPPTTRLRSEPQRLATAAADRGTSSTRLLRQLRGDLSALLAKALALDPAQRYESAQAFDDDLGRWLHGLPLRARAPSRLYRLARAVRRNPLVSTLALCLVLSLAGYSVSLRHQLTVTEAEVQLNLGMRDYLTALFLRAEPRPDRAPAGAALDVLEHGIDAARIEHADNPRLLGELSLVLGVSLTSRGEYERAVKYLREAVERLQREGSEARSSLRSALLDLAVAEHYSGQYAEAQGSFERLLQLPGADVLDFVRAHTAFAWLLHSRGQYDEALALAQSAYPRVPAAGENGIRMRSDLAQVFADIGRDRADFAGATSWLKRAERELQQAGQPDQGTLSYIRCAKAQVLALTGEAESAVPMIEKAYQGFRSARVPNHGAVALTAYRLGLVLSAAGRVHEARVAYAEALGGGLAEANLYIAYSRIGIAWLDLHAGAADAALRQIADAEWIVRRANPDHPVLAEIALIKALALQRLGRSEDASAALRAARDSRRRHFGAAHPYVLIAQALELEPAPRLDAVDPQISQLLEYSRLAWVIGGATP